MYQFLIRNEEIVLLVNSDIFLVLKSTLSRRRHRSFKHGVGSLVDLFS